MPARRRQPLALRWLGRGDYETVWQAMRAYTEGRSADSEDALWVVEHPAVYTLGLNGRREHVLEPGGVPVVSVDRGGQVTYHGPGQIVVYCLLDLRRRGLGVRSLVWRMEAALIDLLAEGGIQGHRQRGAPGVYVAGAKIAALGLRVRRGCSYHGLALNLDLDLSPFARIDPCGYRGLQVTRLSDLGWDRDWQETAQALCQRLLAHL